MAARRRRLSLRGFIILILLAVLATVGTVFGMIYASGFRYKIYHTEEHGTIRYLGKVDASGQPCGGKAFFADGSTADVSAGASQLKFQDGTVLAVNTVKIAYSGGNTYEGETVGVMRNGKGILTYAGGDVYEGDFAYEEINGEGTYYYKSGDVYAGYFYKGLKWGYGTYTWAPVDGKSDVYAGEYDDNMRSGEGTYVYADGSMYTGSWKKDAKSGHGVMEFASGDRYEGEFSEDLRSGKGTYQFAGGDSYTGDFYKNAITGYGTYTFAKGDRPEYTGYFKNGVIVTVIEIEPDPAETGEISE